MELLQKEKIKEGISIIIPVFNSENILPILMERLWQVLKNLGEPYEIILIDDCSKDKSWNVIQAFAQKDCNIKAIKFSKNFGQHNAILCGIRTAKYSKVITMDDDLQHPPEEIPSLLEELNKGHMVIYGTPINNSYGFWRKLITKMAKLILAFVIPRNVAKKVSAFRAFKTIVRDSFANYDCPFTNIDVLLSWATGDFSEKRYKHDKRFLGKSNYTFKKLVNHFFNIITNYPTTPLRIVVFFGFALAIFGTFILIYVVSRAIFIGIVVPGFAFTASIIAIFSGTQLFCIGIIAEYIARIHQNSLKKPQYVIADKIDYGRKEEIDEKQV